jgi:hypothetical protein
VELSFTHSTSEHTVYARGQGNSWLLVGVYVDDLVITGTDAAEIAKFKKQMTAQCQMSDLGLLCFYLGIEVQQGRDGIKLKQAAYASKILERAGMGNCNPCHTLMEHHLKLSKNSIAPPVNTTEYRGLVGCLRYLVHMRLDITFAVGYVSHFMEAAHHRASPRGEADSPLHCRHDRLRLPLQARRQKAQATGVQRR